MFTVIPAPAGTVIVNEKGAAVNAIVGWVHVEGHRADPVCVTTRGPLKGTEAIGFLVGEVFCIEHPASGMCFGEKAAWVRFIESRPDLHVVEDAVKATKDGPLPGIGVPVRFGDKTFKSKSFFVFDNKFGIGVHGLFEVEPETPLPDDKRVRKIKRDDYALLKRDGSRKFDPRAEDAEAEEDAEDLNSVEAMMDVMKDDAPKATGKVINYDDL